MITIIRNAEVYAPEYQGRKDVLLTGSSIARIAENIQIDSDFPITEIDGQGCYLFPGFIDNHVHIAGGGGEGGFHTRTPEIMLTDITLGGVTTVIGTLGTDGTTRTMTNLLAKARGLEEEGITTFINTGSYQVPVKTLTGSVTDDIILIDKIIGAGEIALSDHRSTEVTFDELSRLAAEARLGGLLSGKAGIVNIHVGDSPRGIALIEEIIDKTDIPMKHFVPTHLCRNQQLFKEAVGYCQKGGFVDFTTSMDSSSDNSDGRISAYHTLKLILDEGISLDGVTFSSDGQGSLPKFDAEGKMIGMGVGKVTSLYQAVKDAILLDGITIEQALSVITANPAKVYCLTKKGHIKEGFDGDLVLVDSSTLAINTVIAKGQILVSDGVAVIKGTYQEA